MQRYHAEARRRPRGWVIVDSASRTVLKEASGLTLVFPNEHARKAHAYAERLNQSRWTLSEIRDANTEAGQHFFTRETMRFFGDVLGNFKVRHEAGRVFIERVKPGSTDAGRAARVGELREFDLRTCSIGLAKSRAEHFDGGADA